MWLFCTGLNRAQTFYFGADLSYVNEMEACGAMYNVDQVVMDPYYLFHDQGANLVRLRLWHTPSWYDELNDGLRYSDLNDVKLSISRAKEKSLKVLLDFHLSDNWADPSKQIAPAAWTSVLDDIPVLQDSLYNYIYHTLETLATDDLLPEMVQIGNETNRGILLSKEVNDAGWTLDWDRNSALFNSAIAAVRDIETAFSSTVKIILHIADPEQVPWYIEQFVDHGVTDFDIIGISYYFQWHPSTIEEVGEIISGLKTDFPGKEIMIVETAYPWTFANADNANNILWNTYPGYSPHSPQHQKDWLIALTQQVIDHGGSGVVYWEPAWVSTDCYSQFAQGSSWDNATFFDFEHGLIENGGIGWMSYNYNMTSVEEPQRDEGDLKIWMRGEELVIAFQDITYGNQPVKIGVYRMDGKIVFEKKVDLVKGEKEISVKMRRAASGIYLVMVVRESGMMFPELIFIN